MIGAVEVGLDDGALETFVDIFDVGGFVGDERFVVGIFAFVAAVVCGEVAQSVGLVGGENRGDVGREGAKTRGFDASVVGRDGLGKVGTAEVDLLGETALGAVAFGDNGGDDN